MGTVTTSVSSVERGGVIARLNGRSHRPGLLAFGIVVLAHWVEHLLQAAQIWVFGIARPEAGGGLGYLFPWLVSSEWLHYGYAIVMLAGFALLLPGFSGRSRAVWRVAFLIQVWHHFEHLLLLFQAQTHTNFFDKPVPTSFLQLIWQRAELHLFYNALVTIPMLLAIWLHMRPRPAERAAVSCTCARQAAFSLSPA